MSFEEYEESVEGGRPVELYQFGFQGGTFRYTTADRDVEFNSSLFTFVAGLSRSAIDDNGDITRSDLKITAPENFPVSLLFEQSPPSDVVNLVIYRLHLSDLTDASTVWRGRVLGVFWQTGASELACESIITRMKQPGLRRAYSRSCPHELYGPVCRAQESAFQQGAILNGIQAGGFDVTSPAFDLESDGFFTGGKLIFESSPGVIERRGIRAHAGDTITLSHPIQSLTATSFVIVSPGCDRTQPTCISKFDNLPNYGGFAFMPDKNPFGSSSVF